VSTVAGECTPLIANSSRYLFRLERAWRRRVVAPFLRRFHPKVEVTVGGHHLRIDLADRVIANLLFIDGSYERTLRSFVASLPLNGGVCVDIGANLGLHTVLLSNLVGSGGRVFAFEPEARNFELLEYNLRRNGLANVAASRCALGSAEGVCQLNLSPDNFGDHKIGGQSRGPAQEVRITTLDTALQHVPDGSVRLIKIDVQGYELEVLRGMKGTLERNADVILLLEISPTHLAEVGTSATELVSAIRALGFYGWEIGEDRVLPLCEPAVYDLMRPGFHVDLALARDRARLQSYVMQLARSQLHATS